MVSKDAGAELWGRAALMMKHAVNYCSISAYNLALPVFLPQTTNLAHYKLEHGVLFLHWEMFSKIVSMETVRQALL